MRHGRKDSYSPVLSPLDNTDEEIMQKDDDTLQILALRIWLFDFSFSNWNVKINSTCQRLEIQNFHKLINQNLFKLGQ